MPELFDPLFNAGQADLKTELIEIFVDILILLKYSRTLKFVSNTRLRFAPAPTGSLHLGSARTALFNWLAARGLGGELILRIEDTNAELSKPELIDNIYRSLDWLQIEFDGEPVRQRERTDQYNDAVEQWLSDDLAYVDDGAVRFRVPTEGVTSWYDLLKTFLSKMSTSKILLYEELTARRLSSQLTQSTISNWVSPMSCGVKT